MVNLLTIASLVIGAVAANADGVTRPLQWQSDYGKALADTRSDDRPLLVVLDFPADTKSALESERLDTSGAQGKLLNAYRLCRVDASTKYGRKVAEVFQADAFPFTAIIDKTGSVVLCKKSGKLSNEQWEGVLAAHQTGEKSTASYDTSADRHTSAYRHSSAYRGEVTSDDVPAADGGSIFGRAVPSISVESPSYCPSCQLRSQSNF